MHNKKVQWFHPQCLFEMFPLMRKSSKTVKSVEQLQGYEDLLRSDRLVIRSQLEEALNKGDALARELTSNASPGDELAEFALTEFDRGLEEHDASESLDDPALEFAIGAELNHVLERGFAPSGAEHSSSLTGICCSVPEDLGDLETKNSSRCWRDGAADEARVFEERAVPIVGPEFENRVVAEENGMLILRAFLVPQFPPRPPPRVDFPSGLATELPPPRVAWAKRCRAVSLTDTWEPAKRPCHVTPESRSRFACVPPIVPHFPTPPFWCGWSPGLC